MKATQPTFNEVFDMASTPVTKEELLARLEHADARIDEGHYVEHEVAKQHFQSRRDPLRLAKMFV